LSILAVVYLVLLRGGVKKLAPFEAQGKG